MSAIKRNMEIGRQYYLERADRDIEKYRKGDFSITVLKNGKPYDTKVSYKMKKIDFEFGCNIFMLDQYENKDEQQRYLELWKKLFNTAVVPLYWEGTEPQKDYLRYSKDCKNDVYRRPPVGRVIEYCKQNDIKTKGHPLFWHEFIPKWLPENWDELIVLIEKRFKEISELFAEDIPVFDCVNEPARIWDMCHEHKSDGYKMIVPPDGYLEQLFQLGKKYFPKNELILNEATGAAFCEFKGIYSGYYQLLERLLGQDCKIDRIGLQCHISDSEGFKNIYNAERLYGVLDGYSKLGKPIVLSEIGLSTDDEELQAAAAEQLYKICFSVKNMSGVFWWNLDDNGILCDKQRNTGSENLPYGGLCRNGRPKAAYKVLDRLINEEWTTSGNNISSNGVVRFRGFYGEYEITIDGKVYNVNLSKNGNKEVFIEV